MQTQRQLNILSAGAAQGVVVALAAQLRAETGAEIKATFGAVGAIRERLMAGEACDLIILTHPQIADLTAQGRVLPDSAADLGTVHTGVAVRAQDPPPAVSSAEGLRAALLAAESIYFPDPIKATAGIHFAKVIDSLGIRSMIESRLRTYPNGATAMRAMVDERTVTRNARLIGCTQVTEINNTPGAVLAGVLPKEFELATVYSVGVCAKLASANPDNDCLAIARRFAGMLTAESSRALRTSAGYEFPPAT